MTKGGKTSGARTILRRTMMSSVALLAPLCATNAFAQEPEEGIVVTSSRIVREGYNAPTPLAVVGAEQIETSATANLQTFITLLPAFGPSNGTRENANGGANAGLSTVNLRGLGANRTLVLLDGKRMTPAHENGTIDISLVPQQLVQRVDVVTGGASAVYGSDAIAGVVNFVLDKTYTGLKGEVSAGQTSYEDGRNVKVAVTAGTGFANDRGHFIVSAEVVRDDGIRVSGHPNRNWLLRGAQNIRNPAYVAGNGQPERLIINGVGYSQATMGGIVANTSLRGIVFGENGTPFMQDNGVLSDTYQIGGDWQRNNPRIYEDIAPSESRQNIFARASFDLTPKTQVYAQFSRVRAKIKSSSQPSAFVGTQGPLIRTDNAYLPASVRQQMISAGVTQFNLGNLNYDFGILLLISDRRMTFYDVGATGEFDIGDKAWNWEVYGRTGKTDGFLTDLNNLARNRYLEAADAVLDPSGRIVCRSTLTAPNNGCQPVNLMGLHVSNPSDPGQKYVRDASWETLDMTESTAGGSLTGEPFDIWAGPVSVALSAEYRKTKTFNTADPGSIAANHPFGTFPQTRGESDVKEAAFETVVPITNSEFALGELELSAGARATSYSLSGDVKTWKLGATYKPVDDITFRLTRSHDIRAPNHSELFLIRAGTTGGTAVTDPFTNTAPIAQMFTEGNPNLTPESADTTGIGAVFQPSWFPGFTASVDYWDIKLTDSIGTTSGQNEVNFCFNGTRPDLCANIFRNAAGVITGITSPFINLASRVRRGVDYEASYRTELGFAPGAIALHVNATNNLEDLTTSPGILPNDGLDVITGSQKWKYSSSIRYDLAPFSTTLVVRGHSGGMINSTYVECTSACPLSTLANPTVNVNHKPSAFFLDWAADYDFHIAGKESTFFLNIRNVENKPQPDLAANGHQHNTGAFPQYDQDGRVYRIGLRFKM